MVGSLKKRSERINPVIDGEEMKLDVEMLALAKLRQLIDDAVNDMQRCQRAYISGVERLNQERMSPDRQALASLEESLTFAKDQWYRHYRRVQLHKENEQAQLGKVQLAHRRLRSIRRLKEKFELDLGKEEQRTEQKATDELNIRNFILEREK